MKNMKKELKNAKEYMNKAIEEIRNIACRCKEDDDYCDRCCLLDDLVAIKDDIDKGTYQFILLRFYDAKKGMIV